MYKTCLCNIEFAVQCQKVKKEYKHKENATETNTEHRNKLTKCMKKCVNKSRVTTEKERKIKSIEKSIK